ncbi:hypothetical protein PoB_003730400 [Plakobranchus ocellatus]|uniref:Uncharacterized protein n=1 Tax=Plakobranchus ocellatus TaxID=259542 RepID=A0AAV4AXD8_9GAST|nr:hypothetical protein PoB_003730400 [Plakobranchus ocellatus]
MWQWQETSRVGNRHYRIQIRIQDKKAWVLCIASPGQDALSGSSPGQDAGGGVRTRDRRVAADLKKGSQSKRNDNKYHFRYRKSIIYLKKLLQVQKGVGYAFFS